MQYVQLSAILNGNGIQTKLNLYKIYFAIYSLNTIVLNEPFTTAWFLTVYNWEVFGAILPRRLPREEVYTLIFHTKHCHIVLLLHYYIHNPTGRYIFEFYFQYKQNILKLFSFTSLNIDNQDQQ